MRSPLSLTPDPLAAVRSCTNPGQAVVIAFATGLKLSESPVLERIRSESRGLGAAPVLVTSERVFCFLPDDEHRLLLGACGEP